MMNKDNNHKFAPVEGKYQKQGIRWIRLIPFENPKDGVGLLLYRDLSEPCLYDDWCENLDLAIQRARKFYGVKESDWKSAEEIKKNGIDIINEW